MTTKSVKGITIKDGKLVRVVPFRAGIKKRNADRLAKQWAKKNPRHREASGAEVFPGGGKN